MRSHKISKAIKAWIDKNANIIEEYWTEEDGYGETPYSIWVALKKGWIAGEVHCIHESNTKDFLESVKDIKPCECEHCKASQ
jgi:hypothetical protein